MVCFLLHAQNQSLNHLKCVLVTVDTKTKDEKGNAGAQHAPRLASEKFCLGLSSKMSSDQGQPLETGNFKWRSGVQVIPFWITSFLLPALFPLFQLGPDRWPCWGFFAACVLYCDLLPGYTGSACCAARRDTQCIHVASPPHFLQDKMISFKEKDTYFQCMPLWLG